MSIWKELTNPGLLAGGCETPIESPVPENKTPSVNGSSTNVDKKESILGSGVEIDGNIDGDGDLRVGGRVKGDIRLSGNLILDPGAYIVGKISADNVTVGGQIEGNVAASTHVKLLDTGRLVGDLKAQFLTAARGSRLRGNVEVGWNELETQPGEKKPAGEHNGTPPTGNADLELNHSKDL